MAGDELAALRRAPNFASFEPAWFRFLIAANAVDMIIQKSATGPREQPWYGRKKNLRTKDPLLRYMHAARNVDEHGIEPVVAHHPETLMIGIGDEAVHIRSLVFDGAGKISELDIAPINGKMPTMAQRPPHPRLVSVIDDRFNDKYDPPTTHLGLAIKDASPTGVAQLWLDYLATLLKECEQFAE